MRRVLFLASLVVAASTATAETGLRPEGTGQGFGYPGYGIGYPGFGPGYRDYRAGYPGHGLPFPRYGIGSPGYDAPVRGSGWARPEFRGPPGFGDRGTRQGYGRNSEGHGRGPRQGRFGPSWPSTGTNP